MSDYISRQVAIDDAREMFKKNPTMAIRVMDLIKSMPSAQPEILACGNGELDAQPEIIRCKDCKRNADNGGLYPDGRTRCPIQEHYALLNNGYCHLAERREE